MKHGKTLPIERIRKNYKREWLLIAIDEMDENATKPLRGRLLVHSPHRDEVDRASVRYSSPALVVYSQDQLPPGFVAAFFLAHKN